MLTLDGILQPEPQIAGFGSKLVRKTLTFLNTSGAPALFTVTGDVLFRLVAVVKTTVISTGECNGEVGISGDTYAIITRTDITRLAAGEIWHGTTPEKELEPLSEQVEWILSDGNDIIMTLDAQADSGAIAFYLFYTPLSTDGLVVAA